MKAYHRTYRSAAILREGFRDGHYLMPPPIGELSGVFVSADWSLDENKGADGDAVIALDIPDALFEKYEHFEEGKTYREAMIPAAELNEHLATARVLAEEEQALTMARWEAWRGRLGQERATDGTAR